MVQLHQGIQYRVATETEETAYFPQNKDRTKQINVQIEIANGKEATTNKKKDSQNVTRTA